MKRIFFRLSFALFFLFLFSCENDDKVIEEPVQKAATADTTG